MKITDITSESYSWPRPRPIRNGKYTDTTAGLTITRMLDADGMLAPPDRPSFGYEINKAALKEYRSA